MRWFAVAFLAGCVTRTELNEALDRDGDGHLPVVAGGPDCDETRADVHPGVPELCGDDIDNDCDGRIDDRGVGERTWYRDDDGDGHGVDDTVQACTEPEGYAPTPGDCDDGDPSIQPGAQDLCDGVDQDCDGVVDDDAADLNQFRDADEDGFGTDHDVVIGCGLTPGYVLVAGDCDDEAPGINPAADDVCDGIDQDCNGQIDDDVVFFEQFRDDDGDGDGDPFHSQVACQNLTGFVLTNTDCDDGDPTRNGQAFDFCDGFDQDCDGLPDDDATFQLYYVDHDGDGVGTGAAALDACAPVPGFSTITGDCDDDDFDVNPLVEDDCDGVDSDCDGQADDDALLTLYFPDHDGDGIGSEAPGVAVQACIPPAGHVQLTGDCDDDDPTVSPAAVDLCDGQDQDCDGAIDDDAHFVLLYDDHDGDGVGAGDPALLCANPGGMVTAGGDCDDGDAAVRPGVPDACNDVDDDCDGVVDGDASFELLWPDHDSDGVGAGAAVLTCASPPDHAPVNGDCDDDDPAVRPGLTDLCDGSDQDCDGAVDEDATFDIWFPDLDGDGAGANGVEVSTCDGAPAHHVDIAGDCDDGDASVVVPRWWRDHDGDGYGTGAPLAQCSAPAGRVANDDDCDDTLASVSPARPEVCLNGVDDDCSPQTSCRREGLVETGDADQHLILENGYALRRVADFDGDGVGELRYGPVFSVEAQYYWGSPGTPVAPATAGWGVPSGCQASGDLIAGPQDDFLCYQGGSTVTALAFEGKVQTSAVVVSGVPIGVELSVEHVTVAGQALLRLSVDSTQRIFSAENLPVDYDDYLYEGPDGLLMEAASESGLGVFIASADKLSVLPLDSPPSTYAATDPGFVYTFDPDGSTVGNVTMDITGDGVGDLFISEQVVFANTIQLTLLVVPAPVDATSVPIPLDIIPPPQPGLIMPVGDFDGDGLTDWTAWLVYTDNDSDLRLSVGWTHTTTDAFHTNLASRDFTVLVTGELAFLFPLVNDIDEDGYQDMLVLEEHSDTEWRQSIFYGTGQ